MSIEDHYKYKSAVVWRTTYTRSKRRWLKRLAVINLIYLLVIGFGYLKFQEYKEKDVKFLKMADKYSDSKIRNEIFNILRLKGISLGQGMDIADVIIAQSKELSIPVELCLAVIKKESQFDSNAVSIKGAMGLMQLMPATFDIYNKSLRLGLTRQAAFDPIINIKIATNYIKDLLVEHKPKARSEDELWKRVLIAYSGGAEKYPEAVKKFKKEYSRQLVSD